ncbi:hypothetical protein E4J93_01065 [Collinsella sp. BA40]|nr:hypothetical protein E4J93_01065 [Collinsella sp. BA40]
MHRGGALQGVPRAPAARRTRGGGRQDARPRRRHQDAPRHGQAGGQGRGQRVHGRPRRRPRGGGHHGGEIAVAGVPFATVEDYEARYGSPAPENAAAVIADANDAVLGAYLRADGNYEQGCNPVFDLNAKAVACAIAHRALSAPAGYAGASQYSQTAGPYSASLTFANPNGDVYIGRSELKRLGLAGTRVHSIRPSIGGGDGAH